MTHKDLAQDLGVSETTIKSYRRKFPRHFPLHSQGKPLRFKPVALEVCRRIRQGFQDDLSVEEIRSRLDQEFQFARNNRQLSSATDQSQGTAARTGPAPPDVEDIVQSLSQGMDALLQAQQHANQRLAALQEMLGDFLSLHLSREDTFSQGLEELKRTWNRHFQRLREQPDTQAPPAAPPAAPPPGQSQLQPGPRRVRVRNAYGDSQEYLIESAPDGGVFAPSTEPRQAETPTQPFKAAEVRQPPDTLLRMPLVVRTGTGEYLGVAGKSEGAFSLQDLQDLLGAAYAPPHHFSSDWSPTEEENVWRLHLEQEDAIRPRMYALDVTPVQTPKGNEVALLQRFEIQGNEMPPPNLYAFIRQMKERLG